MRPIKRALADVLVSQYFSTAFIPNRNPGMSTNTRGTLLSFSPKITVQGREEMAAQEGKGKSTLHFEIKV